MMSRLDCNLAAAVVVVVVGALLCYNSCSATDESPSSIVPCPRFCDCFYGNASVVCSMQDGHFPPDLPANTQLLSLRPSAAKIRFLFLHNFASSAPVYAYLRTFQLKIEPDLSRESRTKIRIHQGAFSKSRFPRLEVFSITGGSVGGSLPATFLRDAPGLVSIDLNNLAVSQLERATFLPVSSTLEHLNLSSNNLATIEDETFQGLTKLIRLDLSNNQISKIGLNAFKGLYNLAELLLKGNRLTFPSFQADLPASLALLDVSFNAKLASIQPSVLSKLQRLTELRLSHCPLESSKNLERIVMSLRKLSSLKILRVDAASLKVVEPQVLQGMRLQVLSLNDNQLTSLDFAACNDCFVEQLLVDRNNLSCLCFSNRLVVQRSLRHISAAGNQIGRLGNNHLHAFPGIRTLNVSFNGLRQVNESSFISLSQLSLLDLSNNLLQQLPKTAFLASAFPSINHRYKPKKMASTSSPIVVPRVAQLKLRVNANPLHCNADLLWLKQLFDKSVQFDSEPMVEPTCSTPYPPAKFSKLPSTNFRSFHPTARILGGARNFTAAEGQPINLTCEVFGDPSPRVVWKISPDRETVFQPVAISERRRVVQILLNNVQRVNDGQVTCMAINKVGSHAAVSHLSVAAPKLSWETVLEITLTAFVTCFIFVALVALVVWACVSRRRQSHRRFRRRPFAKEKVIINGGGDSASSTTSSTRQPSKSPSTSTGAESLLNFDELKSSQKHLVKLDEEEPSVHAMLLAATGNTAAASESPLPLQRNYVATNGTAPHRLGAIECEQLNSSNLLMVKNKPPPAKRVKLSSAHSTLAPRPVVT